MQIGICDDQKEIRELMIDRVKKFYPAGDIDVEHKDGEFRLCVMLMME